MTNLIQDTLREDEEEQQSDTTSLGPKKCTSKKIQVEAVDSSKQKIQVKKIIFTNIYHFVLNNVELGYRRQIKDSQDEEEESLGIVQLGSACHHSYSGYFLYQHLLYHRATQVLAPTLIIICPIQAVLFCKDLGNH